MTHPVSIRNDTSINISPITGRYCDTFLSKLQGFTFRKQLDINEGLVLVDSIETRVNTAIHMFFVWTDLAVFWVDKNYVVVHKVLAKSWRPFYASPRAARFVIEAHPSRLEDFQIGDKVDFKNA